MGGHQRPDGRRRRHTSRWVALTVLALAITACSDAGGDPSGPSDPPDAGGKVTVTGDSISVGIGAELRRSLGDGRVVKVIGEPGSGLARPDSFDWPGRLEALARDFPPEVLVFSLGSNDAQDLRDERGAVVARLGDTQAWDREYAARLARSFDAFANSGTTVLWLGHVRTAKDPVGPVNRHVHELASQVAATRAWVVVGDLAEILGTGEEVAVDCLEDDGLHLSTACLRRVADSISAGAPIGRARPAPR